MTKFETIPDSLQESKAFKALAKLLGEVEVRDFYRRANEDLEATIVACETQQSQAKAEVDENPAYKKANAVVKDFRKGLAEILKPLKAKQAAAAELLNYRTDLAGIPDIEMEEEVVDFPEGTTVEVRFAGDTIDG